MSLLIKDILSFILSQAKTKGSFSGQILQMSSIFFYVIIHTWGEKRKEIEI